MVALSLEGMTVAKVIIASALKWTTVALASALATELRLDTFEVTRKACYKRLPFHLYTVSFL